MDYKDKNFENFLNEYKALSSTELKRIGFPRKEFKRPQRPGIYTGTLVAKEWGRKMSIISYFECGEGLLDLVKFMTFRNSQGFYIPPQGELALDRAEVGEKYTLFLKEKEEQVYLASLTLGGVEDNLYQLFNTLF